MKIVKRTGVFETNSSSTHSLALVSKADYEADKTNEKPKYRRYGVAATKEDKLLMACGCCKELFITEENITRAASRGDRIAVNRKENCDETRDLIAKGAQEYAYISKYYSSYEIAMEWIVRVYCELTGKDFDKTYKAVDKKNRSGRACHMKFFYEGALDDAELDYDIIDDMLDGALDEVKQKLRRYFDDETVLLYREFYGGAHFDEDDE